MRFFAILFIFVLLSNIVFSVDNNDDSVDGSVEIASNDVQSLSEDSNIRVARDNSNGNDSNESRNKPKKKQSKKNGKKQAKKQTKKQAKKRTG